MSDILPSSPEDRLQDIPKRLSSSTLFCICCLEKDVPVPYISLLSCSHADYLNNFTIPKIKPKNRVICYQCHEMLKKIKLFKLQVEDSFKLLRDQGLNPECSYQKHNLKVNEILYINIPQTICEENEESITKQENNENNAKEKDTINEKQNALEKNIQPKSLEIKDKKLKNIQDALKIINSNQNNDYINTLATSFQSLTKSILGDNLNILNDIQVLHNTLNPTQNLSDNTAGSRNNNATENIINNTEESKMMIDETNFQKDIDISKEELHPPLKVNNELKAASDGNMQRDDPMTKEPESSHSSNIKKVTLTKEELMQERSQKAASQSYLRSPHRCESCLLGFHYKENLEDHVKRKHTQNQGTVNCDVCLQSLSPGASYDEHTFWHYTRFECLSCGQRFSSHEKAAFHYKRKHTKLVIYKCQHCPYKTMVKNTLRNHVRNHSTCKVCDVICGSANELKTHMTAKHEIMTWTCERRSSTQLRVRIAHSKKASSTEVKRAKRNALKTHTCEHCKKAFHYIINLQRHTKRMHPPKVK